MTRPGGSRTTGGILAGALLALASLFTAGCGEATARHLTAGDGLISYEVPVAFTDLGGAEVFGLPSSVVDQVNSDPVLYVESSDSGDETSYASLRMLATEGQFDPLNTELAQLMGGATLIGYEEISDPDVWGIRMQLVDGQSAEDFQALVQRGTGRVVMTELRCTIACFVEQADLINQIQRSWSLEPR